MHLKTFCSKAWSDVNVNFAKRTVAHCCKSQAEPMPAQLTSDFFNNSTGIQQRRAALLEGVEHPQCQHCWNSYRKTGTAYRDSYNTGKIEPLKFIEVTLDNICDMSCLYCVADSSHKIAQKLGLDQRILQGQQPDYDVFMDWLADVPGPYALSFLGGEVTYSKNFFRFAKMMTERLADHDLFVSIMTNGNTLPEQRERFFDLVDSFPPQWRVIVVVSNESTQRISETIREGLDWSRFEYNMDQYLSNPRFEFVGLCPTLSTLSLTDFANYLEWVGDLAREHQKPLYITGNTVDSGELALVNADPSLAHVVSEYQKLINEYSDIIMNTEDCQQWLRQVEREITG